MREFDLPVDILTSGPWSEPLLRGQPGVGEIFSVRSRKTPYWLSADQQRVVRQLRARGRGPTWFCDGNDVARPILTRAGIPENSSSMPRIIRCCPANTPPSNGGGWRRSCRPRLCGASTPPLDPAMLPGCYFEVGAAQRADWNGGCGARSCRAPLILVQIGNKRTMRRGLQRLGGQQQVLAEASAGRKCCAACALGIPGMRLSCWERVPNTSSTMKSRRRRMSPDCTMLPMICRFPA